MKGVAAEPVFKCPVEPPGEFRRRSLPLGIGSANPETVRSLLPFLPIGPGAPALQSLVVR